MKVDSHNNNKKRIIASYYYDWSSPIPLTLHVKTMKYLQITTG